jgi:hypothetical protein
MICKKLINDQMSQIKRLEESTKHIDTHLYTLIKINIIILSIMLGLILCLK